MGTTLETVLPILLTIGTYIKYTFLLYLSTILIFPLGSVYQERKIWNASPKHLPPLSLTSHVKVYIFNVLWMSCTLLGTILLLPKLAWHKFQRRSIERDVHCYVERLSAFICIRAMVGPVVVRGMEHLPPDFDYYDNNYDDANAVADADADKCDQQEPTSEDSTNNGVMAATTNSKEAATKTEKTEASPSSSSSTTTTTQKQATTTTTTITAKNKTNKKTPAPIYIANHSSQIDVGFVYYILRRFKWIAKHSVLYLPGVGQVMYLGGHVLINRKTGTNKRSVVNLYKRADESIQRDGMPIFIFPQGTRRMHERLPFKDGAFKIAMKNGSPLIPISIDIPECVWNNWYPLCLLWKKRRNVGGGGGGAVVRPVVLTIHPPIQVSGMEDREELKKRCFDVIYSVLPKIGDDHNDEKDGKKEKEVDKGQVGTVTKEKKES